VFWDRRPPNIVVTVTLGVLAVPALLVVLAAGESLPELGGQPVPDDDPDDLDDTPADDAGQRMQTAHANASQTSA
jgi:hypothetical protein